MNHAHAKSIADQHRQKFEDSCSPAAIELVLKVHGLVSDDFYDLQDKYQNSNVGFEPFAGKEICGVCFTEHHDAPPFIKLRSTISIEHESGRGVIVSTIEPNGKAHIWLATESTMYGAKALSKHFLNTREIDLIAERLNILPHGHYLTYELPRSGLDSVQ